MIPFQAAMQSIDPSAAAALAAIGAPRPHATGEFTAHHNAAAIELLHSVARIFPTIARMLGEDAFFEVAAQFVAQHAPTAPASIFYGDRFPDFLRRTGSSASAEYVADIAAIDAAREAARQTADCIAVPYAACDDLHSDRSLHVILHPSVVLLQSSFPAVTGWFVNQPRGDRWVRRWGPEDAMIACTRLDAELWRLPSGGFNCLTALKAGTSLADAARAGMAANAAFDLAEVLAILAASNVVTRVERPQRAHTRRGRAPSRLRLAQAPAAIG
jgi:hypothetical protein